MCYFDNVVFLILLFGLFGWWWFIVMVDELHHFIIHCNCISFHTVWLCRMGRSALACSTDSTSSASSRSTATALCKP